MNREEALYLFWGKYDASSLFRVFGVERIQAVLKGEFPKNPDFRGLLARNSPTNSAEEPLKRS